MAEPKVINESPPLVLSTDPLIVEARRRAEEDPEAAMLWLQSQNPGADRLRAMLEVVAMWAADDSSRLFYGWNQTLKVLRASKRYKAG